MFEKTTQRANDSHGRGPWWFVIIGCWIGAMLGEPLTGGLYGVAVMIGWIIHVEVILPRLRGDEAAEEAAAITAEEEAEREAREAA
jgi:hypothetical protein